MYSTALSVYNASSLIANNAFSSQGNGIYIDNSSPKVSNNFIKATNGYGIQVTSGANAYISSNNITGCSFGIYITNAVNTTITQNLITSNTYGINCNKNSTTIEYNTIANNSGYGILGTGAIRYNTIGNNTCGVAISSLPNNLTQNNIANNAVNLRLYPSNTSLTAPNNWWGTSDPVLINQAITVDHSSSTVSLMPTLSSPDPSAPDIGTLSLLPAPTPTPFATPSPVPSPPPTPTPSYYSYPTPTQPPSTPTPTAVPIEPTSTPTPTPTPLPTPTPTPKIVPGSPLSIGSATFEELLTQLDIMSIAQLVLIGLGIMWTIIISVTVAKRVVEKVIGKTKNQA
jgi:parallel beta-helix repeat protein